MLSNTRIVSQNPWWTATDWERGDPHLLDLDQAPMQLPAPGFVDEIPLGEPAIHVVRGPRQVGKSTGLKLLVRRAIEHEGLDRRSVVYLALDLLADQPIAELAATVARARDLADPLGQAVLLLDEVTAVPRWAEAIKALWDDGTLRRDTIVCTGSSASALARAATERLPGRRGRGEDYLVLPCSFASFATAVDPEIDGSPEMALSDIFSERGGRALRRARVLQPRLDRALERYLRFGGFPAAVREAVVGAREPSKQTRRVVWDSLEREVLGPGASRAALATLLERIARSLSAKTNWSTLAREMDVPLGSRKRHSEYRSVKQYVELLACGYGLLVLYFWKSGSDSNDLSRDKKVYFGDPLIYTVARDQAPGLRFDVPAAVENAMALALWRRYEPLSTQAEGFASPSRLHAWETRRPREIDFVCGPRSQVEMVEVKYQAHVGPADTLVMRASFPGRPAVLVTRDVLRLEPEQAFVPASLMLWALG
jgi:uncharacterized protein